MANTFTITKRIDKDSQVVWFTVYQTDPYWGTRWRGTCHSLQKVQQLLPTGIQLEAVIKKIRKSKENENPPPHHARRSRCRFYYQPAGLRTGRERGESFYL